MAQQTEQYQTQREIVARIREGIEISRPFGSERRNPENLLEIAIPPLNLEISPSVVLAQWGSSEQ